MWEWIRRLFGAGGSRMPTHNLPVEVISPLPIPRAVSYPRHAWPDPWAELSGVLERQEREFADLERQLAEAARRDGLDDDGPMTPTLAALRLSMRNLRQNGELMGRMLRHSAGQLLDTLEARKDMLAAETAHMKTELEHSLASEFFSMRRQQPATGPAQTGSEGGPTWMAVLSPVVVPTVFCCGLFVAGSWLGFARGYADGQSMAESNIHETEWHLRAAFAHGGLGAKIWTLLMESNNIEQAVVGCEKWTPIKTGTPRRACSVPLWIEPDPVAPEPDPAVGPVPEPPPLIADPAPPGSVNVAPPPSPKPARQPHGSAAPLKPFGSAFGLKLLPTPPTGMVNFGPDDSQ